MSKTEYSHTLDRVGWGGLDMRWNDAVPLYARFNVYHFSWKYGSIDQ